MASPFSLHQLADEFQPPETGKQSVVIADDESVKAIVFGFAAGAGLAEHMAPLPAMIQILSGSAAITVNAEPVAGKPGTWIHMQAKTPHSIHAITPLTLMLTLLKSARTTAV